MEVLRILLIIGFITFWHLCPADNPTVVSYLNTMPCAKEINRNYLFNRKPLQPSCMAKLPVGSVHAKGWLKQQLDLMAEGMTGHLNEISPFLKSDNGWLGGDKDGWEEQAYWFRGYHDLAILTGNPRLQAESKNWIESVLASQDKDGYFGPKNQKSVVGKNGKKVCDLWPHMVMCEALINYFEFSKDERVIRLLSHFCEFCRALPEDQFLPALDQDFGDWRPSIQKGRAGDMVPSIVWLYNHTGENWLLELATRFYQHTTGPSGTFLSNHVIDFTQRFAYPGVYSQISGQSWLMDLTEYWYKEHTIVWGQQPRGIFGADENVRAGYIDPRQGFETCGFGEFSRSFYLLGELTGKPLYADRVEDLLFNHFTAAMTPDLKGLHYLTASNQPQLDADGVHDYNNQGRQICYSPTECYRCCQHNVAMTWPRFAENLWQASGDHGVVAWMYAPNEMVANLGNDSEVKIEVKTDYPFKGLVGLVVSCDKPVKFPLYLRIPVWAKGTVITLNENSLVQEAQAGGFVRIERTWSAGDKLEMNMPMTVTITRWPRTGSVTVNRGPLSYSIMIGERWNRCGGTDKWPEWEVFPTSPWNYGLIIPDKDSELTFKVEEKDELAGQPWSLEGAPIHITVKGKRITSWTLENAMVPDLQQSPIRTDQPEENIQMIPLGCARIRMSCLPVIGSGIDAREWLPKEVFSRQ